jgi:geranylgeranyl diphosphate synthase, type I
VPAEPPPSLAAIAERVGARIDSLLAAEEQRWRAVDTDLAAPLAALRAFAAGGKRLRPAFCHWGWVGAGGDPLDERAANAAAALELLHSFALIHDDIMDGSSRRHGQPSMHVRFSEQHAASGWRGEPRRFGEGAAMLIGDLASVYADELLRGAPAEALDVFVELRVEMNVGQYLDLAATAARTVSAERARTICVYKSGKYTIERPLHLGAALAGRLDELAKPYTAYGLPLGEAFQLRDDLLGAFGETALLGKEVGEDVREGKPTALHAAACARARPADRALLDRWYGHRDLGDEQIAEVLRVFTETGARAEIEGAVGALTDAALAALADAPIGEEARRELAALARFVSGREF